MIKVLPAHIATEMLRKKRKDRLKAMLESEINYDNNNNNNNTKKSPRKSKSPDKETGGLLASQNNRKLSVSFLFNKSESNLIDKKASQTLKPQESTGSKTPFVDKQTRPKATGFHDLHIKSHSNVSILYADIVNFTPLADKFEPPELVNILNKLFSEFDQKADVSLDILIKIWICFVRLKFTAE